MIHRNLVLTPLALIAFAAATAAQEAPRGDASRKVRGAEAGEEVPPFNDRADQPGQPRGPGRGFEGPRNPPGPLRESNERPPLDPNRGPAGGQSGFRPPAERGGPRPFPTPPEALEKYDPELYELLKQDETLERQTANLSMQYRRAPTLEREALRKQLAETVNRHFDIRQQRRRMQLKRLEEELQSLREAIEKRDAARTEVIDRRVSELLGVEDSLGF
jgi:hypothetical protein